MNIVDDYSSRGVMVFFSSLTHGLLTIQYLHTIVIWTPSQPDFFYLTSSTSLTSIWPSDGLLMGSQPYHDVYISVIRTASLC